MEEPAQRASRDHGGENIPYRAWQYRAEEGGGNEHEADRDHRHEECRNQGNPVKRFRLGAPQIDSDRP